MSRTYIDFNANYYVRVRLTDRGRKIHRENYRKLMIAFPPHLSLGYQPPKEDADGWSEWQMWALMQEFGEHICMGLEPPFEMHMQFQDTKGE